MLSSAKLEHKKNRSQEKLIKLACCWAGAGEVWVRNTEEALKICHLQLTQTIEKWITNNQENAVYKIRLSVVQFIIFGLLLLSRSFILYSLL